MIFIVSWRNIWRNKLRSSVLLAAIAIGIFAGVFSWAFYRGMLKQRIENAIKTEASHIQIHNSNYIENPEAKNFIVNSDSIAKNIRKNSDVMAVSERAITTAMIMSAQTGSGVQLVGIDPEQEKQVTDIYNRIVDGEYFDGIKRNPIVIGQKLADKLKVKIRSKVVISFQDLNGTIIRDKFKIAGIYKTSSSAFDGVNVFLKKDDLTKLLSMDQEASNEIAILLKNNQLVEKNVDKLTTNYSTLKVSSWREIMPEVSLIEESGDISMLFIMLIILFALCFGIINTMLMAVLERIKELGMLMAVGMNKSRVFFMIMLETIFISLFGAFCGIVIAYFVTIITGNTGVDLSAWSEGYERIGFSTMVYPETDINMIAQVTIMVIITGILASIYPAIKALKLNPADAIRIDV